MDGLDSAKQDARAESVQGEGETGVACLTFSLNIKNPVG
jgi:hypothetical protein